MVTRPTVHGPSTTLAQLHAFIRDDHVHMALLVDGDRLIAFGDDTQARVTGKLDGRTIEPEPVAIALAEKWRNQAKTLP